MPLPDDIQERVRADFKERAREALEVLKGLPPPESDRVTRCVLHLSHGDMERLRHHVLVATQDYRDVIWWAEYDGEERIRDLNKPFERDGA